ncbi:TPA: hypothetical protein TUS96_000002 [Streptococcus equi subsp. zooepidemicus]|nr:hypothetical protein [Streptococcus equi subsp. zooepidemicus]HEL0633845.1 hypothetical protein [Streptococcus equi subsp. zooepidemicus]HEL1088256.1 hypothetical protein [Streptococcus equi subsp. zooepidemicus]
MADRRENSTQDMTRTPGWVSFLLVSGFDLATKTCKSGDQRALMIKMALLFMGLRQGLRRHFFSI